MCARDSSSSVERLLLKSEAFRPRAPSGCPDQSHGVVPRKGKEAADRNRCSPSGAFVTDIEDSEGRLERLRAAAAAAADAILRPRTTGNR